MYTDGKIEGSGKKFTDPCGNIGSKAGYEELGTGQEGNHRLADFDIAVDDIVSNQNLLTLEGHGAISTAERCGHHANPEDDRVEDQ